MTMFGNCEAQAMLPVRKMLLYRAIEEHFAQAMLPVRKMLFDGAIEFRARLNSRCVFCDYAATVMIKERDFGASAASTGGRS